MPESLEEFRRVWGAGGEVEREMRAVTGTTMVYDLMPRLNLRRLRVVRSMFSIKPANYTAEFEGRDGKRRRRVMPELRMKTCEQCRYFIEAYEECRRYPPSIDTPVVFMFPTVCKEYWCGEFAPKKGRP